jgi:DNA-binding transcriptional LysR family regulator
MVNTPWTYDENEGGTAKRVQVVPKILVNDPEAARQAARAGVGVAMLPSWVVAEDIRSGDLEELFTEYRGHRYQVAATIPRTNYMPLKTKRLVDFLQRLFAPAPPWETPTKQRTGKRTRNFS